MISERKNSTKNALQVWLHIQTGLLGLIFLASLCLNGLLILVLWIKRKTKRSKRDSTSYSIETTYTYLLYHLAFADILGVLLNITFDILRNANVIFYFSNLSCQILLPAQLFCTTAQAGTYVALSYHRFRAIVHPFTVTLSVYKSFVMIAFIWFVSVGLSLPYVIVNRFNETAQDCYENWKNPNAGLFYTFAIFIVQYGAPVLLMAIFYISIARTLQNHRVAKKQVHVPTQGDVRSHRHVVKMLVTIVTVFAVCMLPHHLCWIIKGFQKIDDTVYKIIFPVSYLFTYSNSVANPLIFFYYNKESHYHVRKILKKIFCGRKVDIPLVWSKWSVSWSAASKNDSPRSCHDKTEKHETELQNLFPTTVSAESEPAVSLPWEANLLNSPLTSGSYRGYSSLRHPLSEEQHSPGNSSRYRGDILDPFLFECIPHDVPHYSNGTKFDSEDEMTCVLGDTMSETEDVEEGVAVSCDQKDGTNERTNDEQYKEIKRLDEDDETKWECYEGETTRVRHMIERMMFDIREELDREVTKSSTQSFEDFLTLSECSRDITQDDTGGVMTMGYRGMVKDEGAIKDRIGNLPETRM